MLRAQGAIKYFQHIPKTAGTSVRSFLAFHFGSYMCPAGIADQLVVIPFKDLKQYSLFVGHFHSYLSPYLQEQVTAFTLLRDPVSRTRSHWHEVRRSIHHPEHVRVREQTFVEFVNDDLNRVMIEDYQARYLADLPLDMNAIAKRFTKDELSRYALADALEHASLDVPKPSLAESAHTMLGRMALVGMSEQLHDFLVKVAKLLHVPPPSSAMVPRINATECDDSGALPATALERLRQLTQVDQELYDAVRSGHYSGNKYYTIETA